LRFHCCPSVTILTVKTFTRLLLLAWQFYDDASVLTVSVHVDQSEAGQFPFLKGSPLERGGGGGRGANINLPIKYVYMRGRATTVSSEIGGRAKRPRELRSSPKSLNRFDSQLVLSLYGRCLGLRSPVDDGAG
jgi:hypothetical protein